MLCSDELYRCRAENPFIRNTALHGRFAHQRKRGTCRIHAIGAYEIHIRRFKAVPIGQDACDQADAVTEKCYELFIYFAGDIVGGMYFDAYRVDPWIADWLFADIMDSQSEHNLKVAEAFLTCWRVKHLTRPILSWTLLWIDPEHSRRIDWVVIFERFVASVRPDIVLFEPYPYYLPKATPQQIVDRGQLALRRLYAVKIGAKLVSNHLPWMYCAAADFAPRRYHVKLVDCRVGGRSSRTR